jgi:serine/alanine adding enzyme
VTAPRTATPAARSSTAGVHIDAVERPGDDWGGLLTVSPEATFCHWPQWDALLEDVMGADCRWLEARDADGRLCGGLPLARVRSRLLGDFLVSMPFLSYGGPLGAAAVQAALVERAVRHAESLRVRAMELRTRHAAPGPLPVTQRRITVVLPLPDRPESLWDGFRSKLRSQIRRPQKEGMEARFGPDQVDPFYEVFARKMRDLGTPVLPHAWFARLPRAFGDAVLFGAVYDGDRPVAVGCGFVGFGEFEMTWAASLPAWDAKAPNMLLYWSFMEAAIARGAGAFNFGRCAEGGGTHRFKRQWGGTDEPLPWQLWPADRAHAPPGGESRRYAIAARFWSRLPLAVTRWGGPWLARRLP